MTTLDDFSSLLQLGFGTGIALGLFQAPIRLRVDPLASAIANELVLLKDQTSQQIKDRYLALQTLQVEVAVGRADLTKLEKPPLLFSLAGAALNLGLLAWAAVDADREVTITGELLLLLVSVGWFLISLLWIEIIAIDKISPLQSRYRQK